MERVRTSTLHLLGFVGAAVTVTLLSWGCTSSDPRVRTGISLREHRSYDLKIGDPAPDFNFVNEQNRLQRFYAVRGRVTIVAFPQMADWPNADVCRRLAELAEDLSSVDTGVVAVSIASPAKPCVDALSEVQACEIASNRLVTICDCGGQLGRLYGPHAAGKFYVIGNYGRIAESGSFAEWDAVRDAAGRVVERLAEKDREDQDFL